VKLLFDQNLSFKLCDRLADLFPGSSQVRLLDLDTTNDMLIFRHAREHCFTVVTQDGDFADLVAVLGAPPKIIWIRRGNQPTQAVEQMLRDEAEKLHAFDADPDLNCIEIY
jgi:predicted nuclease of predicted toxin-antitoxin system